MQSWLLLLLNSISTVFPLELYLIYSKRTTKPKTISVLAPSTVIVKGLLAFRLQRFPRKVYNLAVLLDFRLNCCYFCSRFHVSDALRERDDYSTSFPEALTNGLLAW